MMALSVKHPSFSLWNFLNVIEMSFPFLKFLLSFCKFALLICRVKNYLSALGNKLPWDPVRRMKILINMNRKYSRAVNFKAAFQKQNF